MTWDPSIDDNDEYNSAIQAVLPVVQTDAERIAQLERNLKIVEPLVKWAKRMDHGSEPHTHGTYTHGPGARCPVCGMPLIAWWGMI